jgi:hypothetical protein
MALEVSGIGRLGGRGILYWSRFNNFMSKATVLANTFFQLRKILYDAKRC